MDGVCEKLAVVIFLVYWSSQVEAQGEGIYLQINGTRVSNHGFVARGDIRTNSPLFCVTPDNITCCSTAETGGAPLGNWYFPNGTEVPTNDTGWLFYITRGPGVARLHRRTGGVSGIHRCVIPDQSGINQTLYVGLYAITSTTSGRILLQHNIEFQLLPLEPFTDPPTFTLTCVTTGGPPTNVTWRRDNTEIDYQSNSNFTFSWTVTNFTNSTYNNTLTVTGRYPGWYNMTAWNRNTVMYIASPFATSALLVKAAAPPTHLTAVQGSDPTTVNVSWTAPVSGASVTGYQIYYQTEGDQGSVDVGATATQHVLTGRCGGMNYSIYLVALSAHLPSPVVGPVVVTLGNTNETVSPNVTTSPITINSIVVTSPFTISPVATTSSDAMNSSSFTSTPAATTTNTFTSTLAVTTTGTFASTPAVTSTSTFTSTPAATSTIFYFPGTSTTDDTLTSPSTISLVATTSSDAMNSSSFTSTPAATSTSTFTSTPTATTTSTFTFTPTATTTSTFTFTPDATITSTFTFTPAATSTSTFTSTPAATTTSTFTSTPAATSTSPFTSTPDAISTSRFISTPDSTNTSSFTSTPAATSTSPFTSIPAATSTSPFTSTPAAISTSRFISTPDSTNTSSFTSTPTATSTSPFTSTPTATSTSPFTSTPTATSTSPFTSTPAATSSSISAFSPNATSTSPFTSTPDITTTILFFLETSTTDDTLTSPSTSTPNATSIFTTNTPTTTPAPTSNLHIPTITTIPTLTPTPTLTSTPSPVLTSTFTHISTTIIPTPTPTPTLTSTPSPVLTPTFTHISTTTIPTPTLTSTPSTAPTTTFTHISTTTSIIFTPTLTPIPTSSLTPTPNITNSTTTLSPTPTLRTTPDSTGVLTGAVVAGVVGAAVLLGLLVLVMCICLIFLRRTKSKQKTSPAALLELVSLDEATKAVSTHGSTVISNTVMDTKKRTENDTTKEAQLKVGGNHKMDRDTAVVIEEFPHDNKHVTEGESVLLHVKVTGAPKPTLVWYFEGKELRPDYSTEVAEEDGSVSISSVETRHAGVYKLVATNTAGSVEKEVKLLVHNEEEHIPDVADQRELTPVPVAEFGKYVEEQHANDNQLFGKQYKSLPKGRDGSSVTVATKPENVPRNKFKDIIVYDDSRVILKPLLGHDDCQHDYINASYVDGHSIPRKFIAAQAPLPNTVIDFWRLIWQEKCPSIVMLTNLVEGGKIKCLQYWPDTGNKSHGPFKVTITDKQMFADYWIRVFQVELSGSTDPPLKVTQFHFTAWPDHGVPDYATPILAFHKRVKSQHDSAKGPLLVHCSAGVGRTGTFITIDNVLEQVEKEGVVDIAGTVSKIRQQRMIMVQTVDQYIFIHDAVLESVTCGDTQIGAGDLRDVLEKLRMGPQSGPTGLASQFQVLDQVTLKPGDVKRNCAVLFGAKNRSTEHLPADSCRVILKGEYPDYINAAFVNGYKQQKAFIIAQGPMESTCRDFWKMVHERQCGAIVMLSRLSEDGKEVCYQYWPSSGDKQYGEYSVDLLGEEELEGRVLRKLNITHSKSGEAHQVTQFHIVNWDPDGRCSNLRTITDVIQEVIMVQMRTGNHPIVVHCSDTVSRSGMFCAIATTIDRCKTEGVVDILQVVKALRVQKPGAILNVEQYQTVFEAVLTYLDSFDTYANFQNI